MIKDKNSPEGCGHVWKFYILCARLIGTESSEIQPCTMKYSNIIQHGRSYIMLSIPANQNRKIRILICTEVTVQEAFDQVTVNGVSSNILNLDAGLKAGRIS